MNSDLFDRIDRKLRIIKWLLAIQMLLLSGLLYFTALLLAVP